MLKKYDIQFISAPSILGLKLSGVQHLPDALLACGLAERLRIYHPVINVPQLNHLYSEVRDAETLCLNPEALKDFSQGLVKVISAAVEENRFAFTLGGDCSILLGIMPL